MEAIDLSLHDAKMSDELPHVGSDEPLGMPSIDISDEVAELGGLFEKAGNYQTLMSEYPDNRILSVSEEKLFNIAANLSLAGTGFTAEDFKLAVKDKLGTHISQEGLTSVSKSIGKAIIDAIKWIIAKIVAFWNWMTGQGGKNEEEKDRATVKDIASISESTLQKVSQAVEGVKRKGITDPNKVTDLGGGMTVHGDTLIIKDNKPGGEKGSERRVNLRAFTNVYWKDINNLFSEPPAEEVIDISRLPNEMRGYLDEISKLAGPMATLNKLNLSISNSLEMAKELKSSGDVARATSVMETLAKSWEGFLKDIEPFAPNNAEYGKALLPSGTHLSKTHRGIGFHHKSPWYSTVLKDVPEVVCGYSQPATYRANAESKQWHLKFGGTPSSIANSYDAFINAYVNAFKKVAPAGDEVKLKNLLRIVDNNRNEASDSLHDSDPNKKGSLADTFTHDLMQFQYMVSQSQSSILNILKSAVVAISQHRVLYTGLRHLAVSDNRPKKKR
jgi:hypothetical protein